MQFNVKIIYIGICRDQERSLGLAWFTLHSRCFHRVFSHCSSSACELAPIFNELVDRVSFHGELLQAALSRQVLNSIHWILLVPITMQVDEFTTMLLEIHDKMMLTNKNEVSKLFLISLCVSVLTFRNASFKTWR
ncbi:Glutathione synthetase chloroplastic [Zea mays]|uniref:Glutathione synthetase chloroplastic n=1 Tax=Zea mays TaxID=4577 RepID=A0A1D6HE43_MAIZE|nr:Glutathione synthetase chloroplastic [Zea mays]